jgi:hypothetical protein
LKDSFAAAKVMHRGEAGCHRDLIFRIQHPVIQKLFAGTKLPCISNLHLYHAENPFHRCTYQTH